MKFNSFIFNIAYVVGINLNLLDAVTTKLQKLQQKYDSITTVNIIYCS